MSRTPPPVSHLQADTAHAEEQLIGQLLSTPSQLDCAAILEPSDFIGPDCRAWFSALRAIAAEQGTLTPNDIHLVIEAVAKQANRSLDDVSAQAAALIRGVWSTANTENDATAVKRMAADRQLHAAMDARDEKKTRAALALIDELDAIKSGIEREKGDTAILIRASDITPEPISWLWDGWLARGKLHVLAGQPGTGKTNIAMGFAAAVTRGGYMPDGTKTEARSVVVWSGEDSIEDTLAPRLIANGADMAKVHFVKAVRTRKGINRPFDPAADLPLLRKSIERSGEDVGLFIVDSVANVVLGDGHKNNQVRRALQPLLDLAQDTKCAAIGITHLTKASNDRDPIDRIVGSVAFGGLARIVMMTAKASDENGGGQLLVRVKSNIGPDGDGFRYEISTRPLEGYTGVSGSFVMYADYLQGKPRDLLAMAETIADPEERGAVAEAKEFVQQILADGPMKTKELEQAAKEAGIARRTLERARKTLGVLSKRGFDGNWRCYLPDIQKFGEVGGDGGDGEVGGDGGVDGKGGQVRQSEVQVRQVRQTVGEVGTPINQQDNPKSAKSAKSANNSKKVDEVEQSKSANHPTTEANGIGGTDEFTHPAPDSTGQPPPFSGSKGGPVISHQQVEATPPASPLARRILQSLTGVPSGMDANELVRQTGNGKGASMVMMEHELAELAKRGLVNRINGRWVAATPSTMGRGTP